MMRLNPNSHAIIVPVYVHGDRGFRIVDMLLDTAATYVTLPPAIAELLGYSPADSVRHVTIMTASGIENAPLITVQRISVLGANANNVDTLCMTLPGENRLRGLLGLSFLKLFDMDVHFKQRVLRFR
jgi:clan AA aspartic protease (TIGR02281 family)